MKEKDYFLGLDIGTDSIGYAVTDSKYNVLKSHRKMMWGANLFDPAVSAAERRAFRVARRRLDRRQTRVDLLRGLFAREIEKVDPLFFQRLDESSLYQEDKSEQGNANSFFNDRSYQDRDYHREYPTIHHLIWDLMNSQQKHDVRLVYLACAWLVAHRGHFLSEVGIDNLDKINNVDGLYNTLLDYCRDNIEERFGEESVNPDLWQCDPKKFAAVLKMDCGITAKKDAFNKILFPGLKKKEIDGDYPFSRVEIITLLCGGKTSAEKLFKNKEYSDLESFSLSSPDELLESVYGSLGDDAGLLIHLKALYDWSVLENVRRGTSYISEAKVLIYEQHKKDLKDLKQFIKQYIPEKYDEIFKSVKKKLPNYAAYVANGKKASAKYQEERYTTTKNEFCDWLRKLLKGCKVRDCDQPFFNDMLQRLETNSFLPKQVESDNRVIPHQLYQIELIKLLKNASSYLSFLNEKDRDGLRVDDKILSVFSFRIPYFVGPLVKRSDVKSVAWIKRKAEGKIYPWNFEEKVDLEACEDEFINRMTNTCTYLPGERVVPKCSLLYSEFNVLNEINSLSVGGRRIPAEVKQKLYHEIFEKKKRPTVSTIKNWLLSNGYMTQESVVSGIDEKIKSSLTSYHDFKGFLDRDLLTEDDVEQIIQRSTYTEDKIRFEKWVKHQFGERIDKDDLRKIVKNKYSEFGRLSRKFLEDFKFIDKKTGEEGSVIEFMRRSNVLLMELLSDRYTLSEKLAEYRKNYYTENPVKLSDRLHQMYLSPSVCRQVYRSIDIIETIRKIMGCAPSKIFVEMARGEEPAKKGKRTKSRYEQLTELYKKVDHFEVRDFQKAIEEIGDAQNTKLRGDALYLWFLQLGRCAYCGKPIEMHELTDKRQVNIDHIYPQAYVKDDSVLNNKVLCHSSCNGLKRDSYPVPPSLRQEGLWKKWHDNRLMTDEKYRRLMRNTEFSEEEKQEFINRQLVETRQTTKAILTLLQEFMPQTEVVSVHARLVSDFRNEYDIVKCRSINDLHHAKDAYLNIVVGNVYHEKFTKKYFTLGQEHYSMKTAVLYGNELVRNGKKIWEGRSSIEKVKNVVQKNSINLTKYAVYGKGALFDQMPVEAGRGKHALKKGVDMQKYGAYNSLKIYGFLPVSYDQKGKHDILLLAIDLLHRECAVKKEEENLRHYCQTELEYITKSPVSNIQFPMGLHVWKIGSVLLLDNVKFIIRSKSSEGKTIVLSLFTSLLLAGEDEKYIKKLESFVKKFDMRNSDQITVSEKYDGISREKNIALYEVLQNKLSSPMFMNLPASQSDKIKKGYEKFLKLDLLTQIHTLLQIVALGKTNRPFSCDLLAIGGSKTAGVMTLGTKFSQWKKYKDVRLVTTDATGLYEKKSGNLLELL